MPPITALAVLTAARVLVADPLRWVQGGSPDEDHCCALTALDHAIVMLAPRPLSGRRLMSTRVAARAYLNSACSALYGHRTIAVNDDATRPPAEAQARVLVAYDRAIEAARKRGEGAG